MMTVDLRSRTMQKWLVDPAKRDHPLRESHRRRFAEFDEDKRGHRTWRELML